MESAPPAFASQQPPKPKVHDDRIRIQSISGLPQRGYVVNIDAEEQGHG
jgi:hypothetical protein